MNEQEGTEETKKELVAGFQNSIHWLELNGIDSPKSLIPIPKIEETFEPLNTRNAPKKILLIRAPCAIRGSILSLEESGNLRDLI